MSDRRSPNEHSDPDAASGASGSQATIPAPGPRMLSEGQVVALWAEFKSGVASCPRDAAPLALAVDGATKSYRFVCTRCGNASLWFDVAPTGIQVRGGDDPSGPSASDD